MGGGGTEDVVMEGWIREGNDSLSGLSAFGGSLGGAESRVIASLGLCEHLLYSLLLFP
jgi:hypothetical protein